MGDFSNNDLHEYFKAGHTGFWKQEFERCIILMSY